MRRLGRVASVGAVVLALLGTPALTGCDTTKATTTTSSARELEQLNRELDQVENEPQEHSAEELKAERDIQRQAKEERETLNNEESNAAKAQSEHEARKHH
jgi:outer membrane murein-binding lipoprotein Lpp